MGLPGAMAVTFPYSGFHNPIGVAIDPIDASYALVANWAENNIGRIDLGQNPSARNCILSSSRSGGCFSARRWRRTAAGRARAMTTKEPVRPAKAGEKG